MRFLYLPLAVLATMGLAEPIPAPAPDTVGDKNTAAHSVGKFTAVSNQKDMFRFQVVNNADKKTTKCIGEKTKSITLYRFQGYCPDGTWFGVIAGAGKTVQLDRPMAEGNMLMDVDRFTLGVEGPKLDTIEELKKITWFNFDTKSKRQKGHSKVKEKFAKLKTKAG